MIDRSTVIHRALGRMRDTTYLEIGVYKGHVFLPVRARRKIAVDPRFRVLPEKKLAHLFTNPWNVFSRYLEMTSDAFFQDHGHLLERHGLSVALVDGLHTYEQALADVENCLRYLADDGLIVMHDCYPPSSAAAFRAGSFEEALEAKPEGWHGQWCGDVYKAVAHLRTRPDLEVFVLDCDMGVGVVRKAANPRPLDMSEGDIADLSYAELRDRREELLGLVDPEAGLARLGLAP